MENIMDKLRAWVVKHKFIAVLLILFLVPFICIYKPYKATNPANPLFIESQFSLSDYYFRRQALIDALQKLLPIGTEKERVEQILVEYGGAEIVDNNSTTKGFFTYRYKPLHITYDPTRIDVYYDDINKVEVVLFNRMAVNGNFETIKKRSQKN